MSLEGEWKYMSNLFSMIPVEYLKIYLHKTNVFMQIHVINGKHFKWAYSNTWWINTKCYCCCCHQVNSVMSDSVQPQRRQPTRLPHPWDSPGKNTGVGCHFLLQCMKVKNESEVAQSCLTPSDPMNCSLPGSSTHGIFQARVLEWVAIAFSVKRVWIYLKFKIHTFYPDRSSAEEGWY